MTSVEEQPWMIVQEKVGVFDKSSAFVCCDRRQHLLILNYESRRTTLGASTCSLMSIPDYSNLNNGRSTRTAGVQTVIYLERIQYIQGGGVGTARRSARSSNKPRSVQQATQTDISDRQQRPLEVYYSTDYPRSEYLFKSIAFQLLLNEEKFDKWVNALHIVIDEAKTLNEAGRQNRWLLREYEKLKRSSKGLTFDSINGWLNSHIGLVGEKKNVMKIIQEHDIVNQSKEITDSVFKAVYYHFYNKQQEILIKILMSDSIENNQILLKKFASRLLNNETDSDDELEHIITYLRLDKNEREVSLKQCISYLWSDVNSAFDPISRRKCVQDMTQPLNHYWISSSHNTYLAKTQLFNPASSHCYIQALLLGCRCVEIDVVDNRSGGPEPEITHKNTRIKPIPLREVLEAIYDYAFVASEYPVIISIENHCSPEQRFVMSQMFIEVFRETLVQSPLSLYETCLPSPKQLKRRIILKDSKMNITSLIGSQIVLDSDEQLDVPSPGLVGRVQLFDFVKAEWFQYNYSFKDDDLFLAKDEEIERKKSIDTDFSDEEEEEQVHGIERISSLMNVSFSSKRLANNQLTQTELTQIWYHGNMSHQQARSLLLSLTTYEIGTFLVRRSPDKNCSCITFLAFDFEVKSIQIKETHDEDGKTLYSLSQKKFESLLDLISHYRTYDFAEVPDGSFKQVPYRLGKPLPRETWHQELEQQAWYQPKLTREQTEELLASICEEMTFLIRDSSNRTRQGYTISVYTNNSIRHSPIYREGSDLMLMSKTFTSLIELVSYFSRKPIFQKLTLQKPAQSYGDFLDEQHRYEMQESNTTITAFKPLEHHMSLKVDTLQATHIEENPTDRSVKLRLSIYEEEHNRRRDGYFLTFDSMKDCNIFLNKISMVSSPSLSSSTTRLFDDTPSNLEKTPTKIPMNTAGVHQSQSYVSELSKLIIYCQGVKLKEYCINKAQDLLDRIRSFKEMISLNYVKAATFCNDVESMIQFNQGHFTRIYPDFSRKSWNSYNFEPIPYWSVGCQMIALNFQTPDRSMHINAGRFATNGGCGYVLMPKSIRSFDIHQRKFETTSTMIGIRIVAVRHLRTIQAKSILKVQVKTTVVSKQKPTEYPNCSTTINGPCGIRDSKHSSKQHNELHAYNCLQSNDKDVDVLYFDVSTDNQEFCGQTAIPLSSLRTGIRSVPLYDRFNERLEMSTLLVDIHFDTVCRLTD